MKQVIVMAGGDHKRFGDAHKWLLRVQHDETIIARIVRQCQSRGHTPLLIVKKEHEQFFQGLAELEFTRSLSSTCHGLLNAEVPCAEQMTILLGDVIYSKRAMDKIVKYEGPFMLFGDLFESFAISFNDWQKSVDALVETCDMVDSGLCTGKLSHWYRVYNGLSPDDDLVTVKRADKNTFHYIHDYTNDMDTQQDWARFQREVLAQHGLDDKKE